MLILGLRPSISLCVPFCLLLSVFSMSPLVLQSLCVYQSVSLHIFFKSPLVLQSLCVYHPVSLLYVFSISPFLSLCLPVSLPVSQCRSVCLSLSMSTFLSVCLSMSVCPFGSQCLSVCLPIVLLLVCIFPFLLISLSLPWPLPSSFSYVNADSEVVLLQASFISNIAGTMYFKQVEGEDVQMWGKMFWVNDKPTTFSHGWHIHSLAVSILISL